MHLWTIYEPTRWKTVMLFLNNLISSHQLYFKLASIMADAVVFLFPVVLLALYLYGYRYRLDIYKTGSIKIFLWVVVAIVVTILIQQFVRKDRPETLPGLQLILSHVPTMSFPSDHATVGFAMGVWLLLLWYDIKKYLDNKTIYALGIMLIILVTLMSISRVAVGIHWFTDIFVWAVIGIIWAHTTHKIWLIKKISVRISVMIDRMLSVIWKL